MICGRSLAMLGAMLGLLLSIACDSPRADNISTTVDNWAIVFASAESGHSAQFWQELTSSRASSANSSLHCQLSYSSLPDNLTPWSMDSRQNNPAPLVQGLPLRFQANFWIHNSQ